MAEKDNSLLARLVALRFSTTQPSSRIHIDTIERVKTPTRDDILSTRLRELREKSSPVPPPKPCSSKGATTRSSNPSSHNKPTTLEDDDQDLEALFQTDDATLEELLGPIHDDELLVLSPLDHNDQEAKVTALLKELAMPVPHGTDPTPLTDRKQSDDSESECMKGEIDKVLARFKDELSLDSKSPHPEPNSENHHHQSHNQDESSLPSTFSLPSLPTTSSSSSSSSPPPPTSTIQDIATRLSALHKPPNPNFTKLPSVPTSIPQSTTTTTTSNALLKSTTSYTDDDVDSWCTVCLEDATLRCTGCDDDPYCARCWREMHLGSGAGFGDGEHRAVQFSRRQGKEKRRVAVGA